MHSRWLLKGVGAASGAALAVGLWGESSGGLSARTTASELAERLRWSGARTAPPPVVGPKWDSNWDFRAPESLVSPKELRAAEKDGEEGLAKLIASKESKATRHIILVRHGQYHNDGIEDNDAAHVLTHLGQAQARQTGKRLRALDLVFDRVIHSTMIRATQTAQLIMKELKPENIRDTKSDSMIEEGACYPIEPPLPHVQFVPHELAAESARIEAGFRRYFHRASPSQEKDSHDLIVCHANVSRYYLMRALQLPPEAWLRLSMPNASLIWISIRPSGNVGLRSFGDIGHMPPDMVTFN